MDDGFEDSGLFAEILEMLADVETLCLTFVRDRDQGGHGAGGDTHAPAAPREDGKLEQGVEKLKLEEGVEGGRASSGGGAAEVRVGGSSDVCGGDRSGCGHELAEGLDKGTAAMVEWLGEGLAECVHWRRFRV